MLFAIAAQLVSIARRTRMMGLSRRPRCPVEIEDLRLVMLQHWNFDKQLRAGQLVVHKDAVEDVAHILARLYDLEFPT